MSMKTSQVWKFVDSFKTQKTKYLKKGTLLFVQTKKFIVLGRLYYGKKKYFLLQR